LLEKASSDPHFAEISGRNIKDWVVSKWNEHETRKTLVLYRKWGGSTLEVTKSNRWRRFCFLIPKACVDAQLPLQAISPFSVCISSNRDG
jgi:hypothetical protein